MITTSSPLVPRRSGLLIPGSSFGPGYGHHQILDVEGVWRCPKLPVLDRVLKAVHARKQDSGDDVPFGLAELMRVATWLKGVAKVLRT